MFSSALCPVKLCCVLIRICFPVHPSVINHSGVSGSLIAISSSVWFRVLCSSYYNNPTNICLFKITKRDILGGKKSILHIDSGAPEVTRRFSYHNLYLIFTGDSDLSLMGGCEMWGPQGDQCESAEPSSIPAISCTVYTPHPSKGLFVSTEPWRRHVACFLCLRDNLKSPSDMHFVWGSPVSFLAGGLLQRE